MRRRLHFRVGFFSFLGPHDKQSKPCFNPFSGQTQIKRFHPRHIPVEHCVYAQYSNSASEALSVCIWVFDCDANRAQSGSSGTARPLLFNVTPVTSDDPLRCWNNAARTVNVTVNVGYCAAAPTPSSYPLCLTLLSLRGSPHITASLGRIIFLFTIFLYYIWASRGIRPVHITICSIFAP